MEKINQLKSFNRVELMGNLKLLVKREKELTLEILDYLQEISKRKLFQEMGYSSLFTFLTEELGYCSGTAYLRIQTMKALEVPENRERVLKDKTSLNTLAKTQSFINNQNKTLDKQSEPLLTEKEKQEFFAAAEGVSANKVEEVLKEKKHEMEVKKSMEQGLPPPVRKILKKFNFEADEELVSMMEELKSLLSHICPSGDLAEVLKKALPLAILEIKIKKGLIKRSEAKPSCKNTSSLKLKSNEVQNPSSAVRKDPTTVDVNQRQESQIFSEAPSGSSVISKDSINEVLNKKQESEIFINKSWNQKRRITRAIPMEIKRKVWKRDGGCCQYQDPIMGKRCSSKHQLEFEHVKPWSLGGGHSLENLWILCRNHNTYRWDNIAK